jgi:hypothetical protein
MWCKEVVSCQKALKSVLELLIMDQCASKVYAHGLDKVVHITCKIKTKGN